MILIFGLGNIGNEYNNTYHNIGFMCLDAFLKEHNLSLNKTKYNGNFLETKMFNEKVVFVKPTTYMNASGTCVLNFIKKFKADISDILVIYDDYDINIGEVRYRNSGSSGTHNGMRDIVEKLQTEDFKRLRVGIRNNGPKIPIINYVLSKIKNKKDYEKVFEKTNLFIEDFIKNNGKAENVSL